MRRPSVSGSSSCARRARILSRAVSVTVRTMGSGYRRPGRGTSRRYPDGMEKMGVILRFIWRSSKRAVVFVVGVALLTVGLIMMVTPGPGLVAIVLGLAVLATEFAWAQHLLEQARHQAEKAGQASQKIPGVSRAWAWVRARWLWVWRRLPWGRRRGAEPATDVSSPEDVARATASVDTEE